ncbi:polyamine aminopropyltransferase [Desulfuribacillus alkaliarsenatis]|uniref:Polyamine aminopropyltransferase n=1 Tax=Desulfuribacillus alkaliarsenatis TaxID=766136 RepID=A0A1E5G1F0_9FIRM|nr:polyamine aminopropyltransferase [Desulfuribacillus alkaliarsenatis]OEF96738.1 spermidine synthase [Desulfuribacillus alkaliarsenatis]
MSELWYTEKQTPNIGITCKITDVLHSEQSDFQKIDIIETNQFGTMLVLDGMVMTTDKDEFVYHEMISHVAMNTHPNPKKVLVVGGGDGGAIREIIKYPTVEKAVLAEIDGRVIELSKQYLPEIAAGLSDPRVDVRVIDGIKHVEENKGEYDIILVDSTEPIGPAEGLFAKTFYQSIYEALKDDGILVAQTESPFFNDDLITRVFKDIKSLFPITRLYLAHIPTYPSGVWSFTMGSKKYNPLEVPETQLKETSTKYYTPAIHKSVFALPKFVQDLLK